MPELCSFDFTGGLTVTGFNQVGNKVYNNVKIDIELL